jgi:ABC-type transporter Mla maintaining outer membrane lipid asymmetry ATPase subunit MlaF
VIIGGSGSGKSVLLKCISGLYQFDNGEIELTEKFDHPKPVKKDQIASKNWAIFSKMLLYLTRLPF